MFGTPSRTQNVNPNLQALCPIASLVEDRLSTKFTESHLALLPPRSSPSPATTPTLLSLAPYTRSAGPLHYRSSVTLILDRQTRPRTGWVVLPSSDDFVSSKCVVDGWKTRVGEAVHTEPGQGRSDTASMRYLVSIRYLELN